MRMMITHASSALAYKIQQLAQPSFTLMVDEADLPQLNTATIRMIGNAYQKSYMLHMLLALALEHEIEAIVSLDTADTVLFENNKILFDEYQIQVLTPQYWL